MSTLQELKIDRGISTQRAVRPEGHIRAASGNENRAEEGPGGERAK